MTFRPAAGRLLAVRDHLARHPVRRDDVGLVGHVELASAFAASSITASPSRCPSRCRPAARPRSPIDVSSQEGGGVPGTLAHVLSIAAESRDVTHLSPWAYLLAVHVDPDAGSCARQCR
jgi:hypothetical protein